MSQANSTADFSKFGCIASDETLCQTLTTLATLQLVSSSLDEMSDDESSDDDDPQVLDQKISEKEIKNLKKDLEQPATELLYYSDEEI